MQDGPLSLERDDRPVVRERHADPPLLEDVERERAVERQDTRFQPAGVLRRSQHRLGRRLGLRRRRHVGRLDQRLEVLPGQRDLRFVQIGQRAPRRLRRGREGCRRPGDEESGPHDRDDQEESERQPPRRPDSRGEEPEKRRRHPAAEGDPAVGIQGEEEEETGRRRDRGGSTAATGGAWTGARRARPQQEDRQSQKEGQQEDPGGGEGPRQRPAGKGHARLLAGGQEAPAERQTQAVGRDAEAHRQDAARHAPPALRHASTHGKVGHLVRLHLVAGDSGRDHRRLHGRRGRLRQLLKVVLETIAPVHLAGNPAARRLILVRGSGLALRRVADVPERAQLVQHLLVLGRPLLLPRAELRADRQRLEIFA